MDAMRDAQAPGARGGGGARDNMLRAKLRGGRGARDNMRARQEASPSSVCFADLRGITSALATVPRLSVVIVR